MVLRSGCEEKELSGDSRGQSKATPSLSVPTVRRVLNPQLQFLTRFQTQRTVDKQGPSQHVSLAFSPYA